MAEIFDTLLLLALPGSGKSEVRAYLSSKAPEEFHMGPTVQLDDYPYVHLQLRVDEELERLGQPRAFHEADPAGRNGPFKDPRELGGLICLLDEDYHELVRGEAERPEHAAARLLERFDAASERAGAARKFDALPDDVRANLLDSLEAEARAFFEDKANNTPPSLDGKTVVIEFARGGPDTGEMPLPPGYGYRDSLKFFSPDMLRRSAILYIWVTPEESRRKNIARYKPEEGGDASILHHTTPASVMEQEYGACDMAWLMETSPKPGTIAVESQGETIFVPAEKFDNRTDLTSFLREDPASWAPEDVARIHGVIKEAAASLWARTTARKPA